MMKKKYLLLLLAALLGVTLLLVGCSGEGADGEGEETVAYYTVQFNSNGGSPVESRQITPGGLLTPPAPPTREGYVFDFWMKGATEWDFTYDTVKEDMTLTASWISSESLFDYERIGETDTAMITGVKKKDLTLRIPTVIAGYSVVAIGENAFYELTYDEEDMLGEIIIPETVTSIGANAFFGCSSSKIIIEGALTEVGEGAFSGCAYLKEIRFAEGMTEVAPEAFRNCEMLKRIDLPSTVTLIDENAFEGCISLERLTLHRGVESVGDSAFVDCDALTALYFYGSEEELELLLESKVSMQYNTNAALTEARAYLYSEEEPTADTVFDGYWYLDEKGNHRLW